VDDNFINQELMKEILERLDIFADFAEDGKKAIEKIQSYNYDIVFMDLHMPEMDGYEATKQIRKNESVKNELPIIALTATGEQSHRKQCLDIGMNDFLVKPFEVQDIENLVKKYCQ